MGKFEDNRLIEHTGQAIELGKQYFNRKLMLFKLETSERTAKVVSYIASTILIAMVFLIALIFASVLLALAIGQLLNSIIAGFGVVSIIYLLIGFCIAYFKRALLTNPILESIIKQMLKE